MHNSCQALIGENRCYAVISNLVVLLEACAVRAGRAAPVFSVYK